MVREESSRCGKTETRALASQRKGTGPGETEARCWTMAYELRALVDQDKEIVSGVMKYIADQATLAGGHSMTNGHDSDTSSTALLEVIGVFN